MSSREKSAWVTLISIPIVSTHYVTHVPTIVDPNPGSWVLHVVAICIAAEIVNYTARIIFYCRGI